MTSICQRRLIVGCIVGATPLILLAMMHRVALLDHLSGLLDPTAPALLDFSDLADSVNATMRLAPSDPCCLHSVLVRTMSQLDGAHPDVIEMERNETWQLTDSHLVMLQMRNHDVCRRGASGVPILYPPEAPPPPAKVLTPKPYRACFVVLGSQRRFLTRLLTKLPLLDANYNNRFRYPVVVFYKHGALGQRLKAAIRACTLTPVVFAPITEWDLPAHLRDRRDEFDSHSCDERAWPLDYLLMNRFFIQLMFREPALADFDFFARIDTDAWFHAPVPFDVFEYLHKRDLDFVLFDKHNHESLGCILGMRDAIGRWAKHANLPADALARFASMPEQVTYDGHFGVGRLSFFRSPEYLDLATFLTDENDGVYKHRWSDQAFYPLALSLLSNFERIDRVGWFHGFCMSHYDRPTHGHRDTGYGSALP